MKNFEVPVNVADEERIIIVDDYVYHAGRPSRPSSVRFDPPEPPEPSELYDIECHWQDNGRLLTEEEWALHEEDIREAVYERIAEESEPDDEPRDD